MSAGALDIGVDHDDTSARGGSAVKRGLDVLVAGVTLLVVAPVIGLVACLIAVTSRGPVLFRQQRVGRNGEPFEVVKFRTMRTGTHAEVLADPATRAAYEANGWKLPPDDPRITTVGRWLRKTSLDELPQLWNVVVGDMSLVGVRPLLADELAQRPEYDQALYRSMRPGMTGLWQVEGRASLDEVDRLALDRTYIERWSLWGDLVLLARTPAAVLHVANTH